MAQHADEKCIQCCITGLADWPSYELLQDNSLMGSYSLWLARAIHSYAYLGDTLGKASTKKQLRSRSLHLLLPCKAFSFACPLEL